VGYLLLLIAIVIEVAATVGLRLSEGFARLGYGLAAIGGYALSLFLLAQAMKTVPLSISYPLWAGLGTAGALLVAWGLFGERLQLIQWAGVALVLLGVVLLNAPKVVTA